MHYSIYFFNNFRRIRIFLILSKKIAIISKKKFFLRFCYLSLNLLYFYHFHIADSVVHLRNSTLVNSALFVDSAAATVLGGGKYIMPLVKLSFYDHFMVHRCSVPIGVHFLQLCFARIPLVTAPPLSSYASP